MSRNGILATIAVGTIAVVAGAAVAISATVTESETPQTTTSAPKCIDGVPESMKTELGKKLPVILVHGINGSPAVWQEESGSHIESDIKALPDTAVASFDYSQVNTNWVTDTDIGFRLGMWVACAAEHSRQAGGPGKVVVVAHSMGGLATRYAGSLDDPFTDGKVSDSLGLVWNIAVPNEGAEVISTDAAELLTAACLVNQDACNKVEFLRVMNSPGGQAMKTGSKEMSELPDLPDNVIVRNIAGDVTLVSFIFGNKITLPTHGDLFVSVESAIAGANGGSQVFKCEYVALSGIAPCWHDGLLKYNESGQAVIDGIQKYRGSLNFICPTRQDFERIRNILDLQMYGEAGTLQQIVVGDVFCEDTWALAPTKNRVDELPGIGVMQYQHIKSEWRLIDYRGSTFEACEKGPPKIKEMIGC